MNKNELIKKYTKEQIADMLMELQGMERISEQDEITLREELEKTKNERDTYIEEINELKNRESKTLTDYLPIEPIMVASMLINVTIYPEKELRQIAEHLLVYCNANKEDLNNE